jgi:hypothetical protein
MTIVMLPRKGAPGPAVHDTGPSANITVMPFPTGPGSAAFFPATRLVVLTLSPTRSPRGRTGLGGQGEGCSRTLFDASPTRSPGHRRPGATATGPPTSPTRVYPDGGGFCSRGSVVGTPSAATPGAQLPGGSISTGRTGRSDPPSVGVHRGATASEWVHRWRLAASGRTRIGRCRTVSVRSRPVGVRTDDATCDSSTSGCVVESGCIWVIGTTDRPDRPGGKRGAS